MIWLKCVHVGIALCPWIAAIVFRKVWIILLCLAAHVLVMAQWSILGNCVLNRIENGGTSDESEILLGVADWLNIDPEELKRRFILVNILAPIMLHLSRLAGAHGL